MLPVAMNAESSRSCLEHLSLTGFSWLCWDLPLTFASWLPSALLRISRLTRLLSPPSHHPLGVIGFPTNASFAFRVEITQCRLNRSRQTVMCSDPRDYSSRIFRLPFVSRDISTFRHRCLEGFTVLDEGWVRLVMGKACPHQLRWRRCIA
jgi:hypothetical protein